MATLSFLETGGEQVNQDALIPFQCQAFVSTLSCFVWFTPHPGFKSLESMTVVRAGGLARGDISSFGFLIDTPLEVILYF